MNTVRGVRSVALAVLLTAVASSVRGQQPAPADTLPVWCGPLAAGADSAALERPDVLLRTRVHIERLRFDSEPLAEVRLLGCPVRARVTERVNLPEDIQPGVTYRDVTIAAEWAARLDIVCLRRPLAPADSTTIAPAAHALLDHCLGAAPVRPDTIRRR